MFDIPASNSNISLVTAFFYKYYFDGALLYSEAGERVTKLK